MLRAVFGPPNMPKEAVAYHATVLKKVFDLPEFQEFLEKNVLDPVYMGPEELGKRSPPSTVPHFKPDYLWEGG